MSGIAGIWTSQPHDLGELAVFTDMLESRGLSGRGFISAENGRLGLGYRESIRDPERQRAAQPYVSADRRFAIVLNGEIYNRHEIIRELDASDSRLGPASTLSDHQIFLAAYTAWGPACQNRMNGDWAVAIWDDVEHCLVLSRDRLGNKPLLYAESRSGFAFASERKAFFALPWLSLSDRQTALESENIKVVQSGSFLTLRTPGGPIESKRWWFPLDHVAAESSSYPSQVEKFRDLLVDSCRIRLEGSAPIAATVSGGMDSSSVVAIVTALQSSTNASSSTNADQWRGVFTATAKGTPHDELKYALSVCDSLGVDVEIVDVLSRCRAEDIDDYLYLTEGLGLNHLTGWYLYQAMRGSGATVSIDGHGADEMMVGEHLDVYRVIQLEGSWLRHPRRTLELARIAHSISVGNPYVHKNSSRQILLKLGLLTTPPLRNVVRRLPGRGNDFPKISHETEDAARVWDMARDLPPLQRWSFFEMVYNNQFYRERFDLLGMSNQINIRYPFLDWRVACFTLSLPPQSVLGRGYTKRILRDAMRNDLPSDVVQRKNKLRFEGAVPALLKGPLRSWILSMAKDDDRWSETLDSTRYSGVIALGHTAVRRWRELHFPEQAKRRAAAAQSRFDADPQTALQATTILGEGD